jgi:hypothetical protein
VGDRHHEKSPTAILVTNDGEMERGIFGADREEEEERRVVVGVEK